MVSAFSVLLSVQKTHVRQRIGYVFRGEFRAGVFEGVHAELIDGVEQPSGMLHFRADPGKE